MSRNGSGTYTLPQSAFTPNTTISSAAMNSDLSDIATALTASICADGQSPITGQLKAAVGANPQYSFTGSTTSGFGSDTAGHAQIQAGGVKVFDSTSTTVALNVATTVTGTLHVTGACTFDTAVAALTITTATTTIENVTTLNVSGIQTNSSTSHWFPPSGTTGQRSGAPTVGMERYNSTLSGIEFYNGTAWIVMGQAPTVQRFTSGTTQTYTPTPGTARIRVRMTGGGGGGAAAKDNAGNSVTPSTDTSFGSWVAKAGAGGAVGGAGGAGGSSGGNGTGTLILRLTGGQGASPAGNVSGQTFTVSAAGGAGGQNVFGGAGQPQSSGAADGGSAAANTGAGGSGASHNNSAQPGGAGGGAGEYVEFWVTNPGATTYTVGVAGIGGVAGTNKGGDGAAGIIIIEEYYA